MLISTFWCAGKGSEAKDQAAATPATTAAEQAAAQATTAQQPGEQPQASSANAVDDDEDDDDENETCGFCRFMKGGGCRSAFISWSKCVDKEREAGGDFTEECREKTLALRECMLQHADYYRPMLEEEEEAMREEEQRAAAEAERQGSGAGAAAEEPAPPGTGLAGQPAAAQPEKK
ncbi:hypothetical protein ABPG77_009029 [Micractinium sp. CCAP 211/92]